MREIREMSSSKSEAIGMGRRLCARHGQIVLVVDCPKAIPRRYYVVDEQTYADEFCGLPIVLTCKA